MTPHPQPEYYLITEEDIEWVWNNLKNSIPVFVGEWVYRQHSRPYTPAKSEQEIREKVLEIAITEIEYAPFDGREALVKRVEKKVRDLR